MRSKEEICQSLCPGSYWEGGHHPDCPYHIDKRLKVPRTMVSPDGKNIMTVDNGQIVMYPKPNLIMGMAFSGYSNSTPEWNEYKQKKWDKEVRQSIFQYEWEWPKGHFLNKDEIEKKKNYPASWFLNSCRKITLWKPLPLIPNEKYTVS